MKKTTFLLALFFGIFLFSCKKESSGTKQNITIGALLSLTGNWSTLGVNSKAAIEIALTDINDYLQKSGSPYVFSSKIYDTKLDTALAQQAIKDGKASGIKYFIGPQSSAEVGAIINYANTNNLLIVSQGSTASSLAISNDAVYRFCPGDSIEGAAVAVTIKSLGCQYLITASRNDAGNKGLQNSVGGKFSAMGGTTFALAPYPTTQTDFSAILATLKTKLQDAILQYGANKVGVYLSSFDEGIQLFQQASSDPVLSSVRWYGGDGLVLSSALLSNAQAASFAAATKFFAPTFGLPMTSHADLSRVSSYIKSKTGVDADAYALSAYDATWVIAQSIMSSQSQSFSNFLDVFELESSHYYGLTGPLQLNNSGDRNNGSFDYWGVASNNGTYQWNLVGKSQ